MAAQQAVLETLNKKGSIADTLEFAAALDVEHQAVVGAIKSLEGDEFVASKQLSREAVALTEEGQAYARDGSPEFAVVQAVEAAGSEGLPVPALNQKLKQIAKIGMSKAMQARWVRVDKSGGQPRLLVATAPKSDEVKSQLESVARGQAESLDKAVLDALRKRKLVQVAALKYYSVTKGPKFSLERKKAATDLTAAMLASGAWQETEFKAYNFDAMGVAPPSGHLHPLLKVRSEFREIFLQMGFEEMPTNNFVESSFWNFDALFQPQAHPARDMHDTFFLKNPEAAHTLPAELMAKVKTMHESGGHGSIGYGYNWKESEARKNLLRTHTTAVSSRMLHKLASNGFQPAKYFSIDRVFRNETLDATHLAEFHQIEGVVADYNLQLSDLMGLIEQFFSYIGMTNLRFKPTYNPYTEPSMEVFSYHEGLGKWVEIGNSGVFRPEMLIPLGLPKDVSVVAWGLSLERPTMIKYGYKNIRDLVGAKVPLDTIAENALCRL